MQIFAFIVFFMCARDLSPRLRYGQVKAFGWKVLLPLSILNVVVTAGVIVFMDS